MHKARFKGTDLLRVDEKRIAQSLFDIFVQSLRIDPN